MLIFIFCDQVFTCCEFFPLQMYLNYLANYVPNTWNYEHGCSHCDDDLVDLSQLKVSTSKFFFLQSSFVHIKNLNAAVESLYLATSLLTLERTKHHLVFQHELFISVCLDSWRGTLLALF